MAATALVAGPASPAAAASCTPVYGGVFLNQGRLGYQYTLECGGNISRTERLLRINGNGDFQYYSTVDSKTIITTYGFSGTSKSSPYTCNGTTSTRYILNVIVKNYNSGATITNTWSPVATLSCYR